MLILLFFIHLSIVSVAAEPEHHEHSHFHDGHSSADFRLLMRIKPIGDAEKSVRPVNNSSRPIMLNTWASVVQIISIEERDQVIQLAMWLVFHWQDDFISWNPADYEGLTEITTPSSFLWLPDVGLTNSVGAQYDFSSESIGRVRIKNNGLVNWCPSVVMKFACYFDMTYFPFDRQKCSLHFESFTYKRNQLDFYVAQTEADSSGYMEHGAWSLTRAPINVSESQYGTTADDDYKVYGRLTLELHLKRKSTFYVMNIITPCMIISVLVMLVFCLPPEAGEKVSLGITILLAFSVFQLLIADLMPRTSDTQPILVLYVTILMFLSMLSIVLSVAVLNLHHFQINHGPPRWLRRLIFNGLAKIVFAHKFIPQTDKTIKKKIPNRDITLIQYHENDKEHYRFLKGDTSKDLLQCTTQTDEVSPEIGNDWRAMAQVCDRFLLALYFIATILAATICFGLLTTGA